MAKHSALLHSVLPDVLAELSHDRPVFHSEADFQHSLAWVIHARFPDARVRLQVPWRGVSKAIHCDLVVHLNDWFWFLELKYKTRALSWCHCDEDFLLSNHSAQDLGRYDFLKDVSRLESLVTLRPMSSGSAILLTNDSSYWEGNAHRDTIDKCFRVFEGRRLTGSLSWGVAASSGTTRGRQAPVVMQGEYCARWTDYSCIQSDKYQVFRYLNLQVDRNTTQLGGSQ